MALTKTRAALKDFARENFHAGAQDDVATARIEIALDNALKALARKREWSFHRDTYDVITTPDFHSAGATFSVSNNGLSVSDSATSIPTTAVGSFIEFNGERHWYEVTERSSGAACTLRQAYSNEDATGLTNVSAIFHFPLYDLPASFRKEELLFDTNNPDEELAYVDYGPLWLEHAERAGVGDPLAYGLVPKRNDPNVRQLMLYPAPDVQKRYTLAYFRQPGWFSTAVPATSSWVQGLNGQADGTYDAYYVDWPDALMHVLESAVLAQVAKLIKPGEYAAYKQVFEMDVKEAASFDKVNSKPRQLSCGSPVPRGMRARFQ